MSKKLNYNSNIEGYNAYHLGGNISPEMIFNKRIWRVDDVANVLGCTVGHVYNLSSDEKIPKRKKNGLLFFIPEEVLNWALEGD